MLLSKFCSVVCQPRHTDDAAKCALAGKTFSVFRSIKIIFRSIKSHKKHFAFVLMKNLCIILPLFYYSLSYIESVSWTERGIIFCHHNGKIIALSLYLFSGMMLWRSLALMHSLCAKNIYLPSSPPFVSLVTRIMDVSCPSTRVVYFYCLALLEGRIKSAFIIQLHCIKGKDIRIEHP